MYVSYSSLLYSWGVLQWFCSGRCGSQDGFLSPLSRDRFFFLFCFDSPAAGPSFPLCLVFPVRGLMQSRAAEQCVFVWGGEIKKINKEKKS